ncbi:amidohydrolase family protein [Aurantibacillus circumpalustris]|uniref:amidohydrolase family protein n=1 Tax=Aurantibacillus circumpalustris TaxID=3036359 RepID=UPI00295C13C6|nr:amidohydrolase family protein [Aurantibacillus circumpalustris]
MRFLKADKLFDGKTYLSQDAVLVVDREGVLREIISENELDINKVEYVKGIISPGFVNAHCHLELSHLKNKIPQSTGLPAFAKQVVSLRNSFSIGEVFSAMHEANLEMQENGIVAVGDISNASDSFEEKQNSSIYYHTFIELLGLNPINAAAIFERGKNLLLELKSEKLAGSLAPHAPYSTSKELIQLISEFNFTNGLSFSIHNQESLEEKKFLEGSPSAFEELFSSLGLDLSWYKATGNSGLKHYFETLSNKPSILVHNTFSTSEDIQLSTKKNIYWCFCPGANMYIENKLPNFSLFANQKNKICFGTDSLASNTQLDVIAEANLVLQHSKEFSLENVLQALTFNGSEALGISDKFGRFIIGKNAGLNQLEFIDSKINFIKKIA